MELTVADAAQIAGVSRRTVQRALGDGRLGMARVLGRQVTTDDLAVQAWVRTTSRGRKWSSRTLEAAIDLLSGGQGDSVSSSERSRLRAALREMTARQIASSSWIGTWSRYRTLGEVDAHLIGPSIADLSALGIVAGESWMRFAEVVDLDQFEASQPVAADPDGDLVVIERPHDNRGARWLVDTYVLGDARESAAATSELESVAHAL
ncbi:helix-turn-helix domain-containing protein [Brachybacterium sp. p3-SID957]|uniref:helix-turn-helix domain-containing protein n=1 Tax=Brachybacterium sp. p3-SID957 TaxID=2916049 RepID=UPI00223AC235|nr:helix-turn-helix domain-containing protein [Brachybacterium sp. p3-SID957]MCT1774896.1 excisionase family DNA-binding protein [Brachybacterium sp. p3-SID957]